MLNIAANAPARAGAVSKSIIAVYGAPGVEIVPLVVQLDLLRIVNAVFFRERIKPPVLFVMQSAGQW
jgi:hypothetical protein